MATTKEQILGIPPIDSSLQGAPNAHEATLQQMGKTHDNGGVQPNSGNTPTLANQSGGSAPVQTGEDKVAPPAKPVNEPAVATNSVQGEVNQTQQAATKQTTQQPQEGQQKQLSYVELFEKLTGYKPPTKEELEAERKRRRRKAIFAAIGDGVSALANLYFVGQRGSLNAYDGKKNMSDKLKAQWDKEDKEREAKQDNYLAGYMQAYKMDIDNAKDARNWAHKLKLEEELRKLELAEEDRRKKNMHSAKPFSLIWRRNIKAMLKRLATRLRQPRRRATLRPSTGKARWMSCTLGLTGTIVHL